MSENICLELRRLGTYEEWPHNHDSTLSKEMMAKAGYFYLGHGDTVRCFVCHIKLNNWEPGDNPWDKHSSMCLFGRLRKQEGDLTVEQWLDVLCNRATNNIDRKYNKLIDDPQP